MKGIKGFFMSISICISLELIFMLLLNSSNCFGNAIMEFIATLMISILSTGIFWKIYDKKKNTFVAVAVFITNICICCVSGNLLYFYFAP